MVDQNKEQAQAANFDDSEEQALREAIELLYFSYRAFTAGPDQILARRGLNRIHHRILYFVNKAPGSSVNELLQVLQISKQALHMPLRQLVGMGLVTNKKSAVDGRVRELALTAEGRRLERRLTGTQQLQLQAVFDSAGSKAQKGWRQVMTLLARDDAP
jgi:DNA-binding MarR family transcriptional regulator